MSLETLLGDPRLIVDTVPSRCTLWGCNLHPARWQKRFPRAPLTYTLASHAQLPGGLKMIASSWPTELDRILTHFSDVATIRITYEVVYCCLTLRFRRARKPERSGGCRAAPASVC